MASAFELMGHGMLNRSNLTPASALGMELADTVVGFGGSFALAEIYTRYPDKWAGKNVAYLFGGVGKFLGSLATVFLGPGLTSGILNSVGQVGVNAIGMDLGFAHARKDLGIALVKVAAGTDVKTLKKGGAVSGTAVGAIPQAAAGRGLSWSHIQELNQMV